MKDGFLMMARVVVWILFSTLARASETTDGVAPRLQFSIESGATEILPCEPMQLKLVVANKNDEAVKTTLLVAALECICVQYENEAFEKWRRGWINWGYTHWNPDTIGPGESREYFLEIVWQEKYPVFEKVGKYRIKADWSGTAGRFTAFCDVVVREASGREKLCLEKLRRENLLGWLGLDSDYIIAWEVARKRRASWRDDLQMLYRIAKEYSDTRYAEYCLSTVLTTIESSYLRRAKAEPIDVAFKREVVKWAEQRCAQQTDARTLYSYARYLHQQDKHFRGTLERAQKLLKEAHALDPDVVLEKRVEELGIKAQIDLRPK